MLDKDCNIKLIDFGFQAPAIGIDGTGFHQTNLGTKGYMAPELVQKKLYKGTDTDLFASFVILFCMVRAAPPFLEAKYNDPYYKLIFNSKQKEFWMKHSGFLNQNKNCPIAKFLPSDEFKDLVQTMFQYDMEKRLNIDEIINHPWMKGDTMTPEELQAEFKKRKQII